MRPCDAHPPTLQTVRARGLTLLESMLAIALLALIATTISGVLGAMHKSQRRSELHLAAAEVANRVLIQYLDDKWALFDQAGLPIGYGPDDDPLLFRWEVRVGTVGFNISDAARAAAEDGPSNQIASIDAVDQVTVWVWLSEESGGSYEYTPDVPSVVYTRLYAPIGGLVFRSQDSVNRMLDGDRGIQEIITAINASGRGAGWRSTTGSQSGGQPPGPADGEGP